MGVRQCLSSGRRKSPAKKTMPMHKSATADAKEKTQKTKNPLGPEGTGTGLSRHCSARVFSSQTIDLQVVGESLPCQQTQSGSVAITGLWTLRRSSSSWVTSNDWHRSAIQPTSFPKMPTTVSRYDCLNVSPCRAINGMPRCCPWPCPMKDRAVVWSPVILIPKWSDWVCVWAFEKCVRDLSTDRILAKRICCGVRGCDECGSLCDLWPHVLATGDASGTQQSHDQTNQRTRRYVEWSRWDSHCRCQKKMDANLGLKEDALILHAIHKVELMNSAKSTALASFAIDFSVAEKFGFVVKTLVGGYKLGPNLQFTLPDITYRTRQNLPTPRCYQPIIGMENIMWGFSPSIWRQAWWISYSKWKITDCNCRSKWNGVLTTSMPPSKRSWVSGNVWR